ncbi:CBS domain-containing protein [Desulfotomaculum sp. 1211_IL3151]|uniref:CBS domain-containing protein n=1 Tax=Desulfotomaculum sp. 1211_IL3151 TaxID=3084055 RepID=UPI002FD9DC87
MQAKDIMSTNVITVKGDTTIKEIAEKLIEEKISGVPVVDEEENLIGIVTEGDLLHKEANPRTPRYFGILGAVIYFGGMEQYKEDFKKLAALKASEIMTTKVVTAAKETEVSDLANLMIKHNIKRIPITENDKIIGMVSRADIIKTFKM